MKKLSNRLMIAIIIGVIVIVMMQQPSDTHKAASGDITSTKITRTFSATTYKVGTPIAATYTVSGVVAGSWIVSVEDDVTQGGCTPATFDEAWNSPVMSKVSTTSTPPGYTAPSSLPSPATCTFSGTATFAGLTTVDSAILGTSTINLCVDQCSGPTDKGCIDSATEWTCSASANPCYTKTSSACEAMSTCSAGVCNADCGSRALSFLTKVGEWKSSGRDNTKKTQMLQAGQYWAEGC